MQTEPAVPAGNQTVLVVDDDHAMRRALDGFLRRHGFPVVTAGSAEEAVVSAAAVRPSVLLCDWHVAQADGVDVIRAVQRAQPHTRCILMSGDDASLVADALGSPWLPKGPAFLPRLKHLLGIDEP